MVDALGNPVKFLLSSGNDHDITQAEELTKELGNTKLFRTKAMIRKKIADCLSRKGCEAVIPSRSNSKENREIDMELYKERCLIENFFS
ncbi:MAG: transposase, partial [Holosporaceae bacterium]|nr:transposase [Holosporaceae bacterium]